MQILHKIYFYIYIMDDIRIINDKTGDVKYVSQLVANDTKMLAYYGFKIQHLEKKEDKEFFEKAVDSTLQAYDKAVEKIEQRIVSEIQVLNPAPKRGRKPNKL